MNPSEAIRPLIAESLPIAKADHVKPVGRELPRFVDSGTRRVKIRLTESEHSLAKGVAAADGFTRARWISALVRSRLGLANNSARWSFGLWLNRATNFVRSGET